VLGFTFALALATSLIFGFVPAWRSSSPDLVATLKEGGRGGSSKGRQSMRSALVVAEVALSLLLLTGAGRLIKSLDELHQVDKGFDETNVLTLRVAALGIEIHGGGLVAIVPGRSPATSKGPSRSRVRGYE
jgi:hypothetical protein